MITATIIADSFSPDSNQRITTFELTYPRYIHSEVMTHRQFSRNAASSRAIPVKTMLDLIEKEPAMPIHWGKNKSGMQADEELTPLEQESAKALWMQAAKNAVSVARIMTDLGLHKQVTNRILEPFQVMKTVVTATDFQNFFWLRSHKAAQPEIHALSLAMEKALSESTPVTLQAGEWHTPYFKNGYWKSAATDGPLQDALMVSSSCCAQVSYRKLDDSMEKAIKIYNMLIKDERMHASALEHCATPIIFKSQTGVTHITKDGTACSGNFRGWVQYRQTIPGHDYASVKQHETN